MQTSTHPTALPAVFDSAFLAERAAWRLVSGHLPGQDGFNPVRWNEWLAAVARAGEAARQDSIADELEASQRSPGAGD